MASISKHTISISVFISSWLQSQISFSWKVMFSECNKVGIRVCKLYFSGSVNCIFKIMSFELFKFSTPHFIIISEFWSYVHFSTIWNLLHPKASGCLATSCIHYCLNFRFLCEKSNVFCGGTGWVSSGVKLILWREGIKCNGSNVQTHQFHFSRLTVSYYIRRSLG